jgi:hypothetical protein
MQKFWTQTRPHRVQSKHGITCTIEGERKYW